MKKLMMDYVTARFMHKMSKCKERELKGEDVTMVLQQNKRYNLFLHQGERSYFYCGKPVHITLFATEQRITSTKIQKMQITMTTTHL